MAARRDADVAAPMRGYVAERADWLAGLVRRPRTAGELDPALPPSAVAHFCLSLAVGTALVSPDLDDVDEQEWAALLDRLVTVLARPRTHPRDGSRHVRVLIDPERCQGHGRCYDLAPDLFGEDEDGYGTVLGDGAVPPDREDDARLAAANCPEAAVDDRGGLTMTVEDRFAQDYHDAAPRPVAGQPRTTRSSPGRWRTGRPTSPTSSRSTRQHAPDVWEDLRGRCPIAHTDRFGGGVAAHPVRGRRRDRLRHRAFSSRAIIMSNFRPPRGPGAGRGVPPISSDPPFHHDARKLLLPAFTKTAVSQAGAGDPGVLRLADRRVRRAGRRRRRRRVRPAHPDAGDRRHARVPAGGRRRGSPGFVENALEGVNLPPEERIERMRELFDYLFEQIRDHIADPRDDLTCYLIDAELYGQQAGPDRTSRARSALLLIAGIDTTWSAIGASLWHLAGHPDDRRAAGRRARRCCRPRWRSSCGPTRR